MLTRQGVVHLIWLVSACLSWSTLGTALSYWYGNVAPFTLSCWRSQCIVVMSCLPYAYKAFFDRGSIAIGWRNTLYIAFVGGCSFVFGISFLYALQYTTITRAYLLGNTFPLMLIVIKVLMCAKVTRIEVACCLAGFLGTALATVTKQDTSPDGEGGGGGGGSHQPSLAGDMAALLSALACLGYFNILPIVSAKHSNFVLIFPINLIATLGLCAMTYYEQGKGGVTDSVIFSNDPTHGMFGWFNTVHSGASVYLVVAGGGFGIFGYAMALQHFSPLVVSLTCLLEPILGSFVAVAFHQDVFPAWGTILGGVIILISVLMLIIDEEYWQRKDNKDTSAPENSLEEKLLKPEDDGPDLRSIRPSDPPLILDIKIPTGVVVPRGDNVTGTGLIDIIKSSKDRARKLVLDKSTLDGRVCESLCKLLGHDRPPVKSSDTSRKGKDDKAIEDFHQRRTSSKGCEVDETGDYSPPTGEGEDVTAVVVKVEGCDDADGDSNILARIRMSGMPQGGVLGERPTGLRRTIEDFDFMFWKSKFDESSKVSPRSLAKKSRGASHTPSMPSSPNLIDINVTVERIVKVLTSKKWRHGPSSHFAASSELYRSQIASLVSQNQPISLVIPSYPVKCWNPIKCRRDGPDLAEVWSLLRLYGFARAIEEVYPPGGRVIIVCDGLVYAPLFNEDIAVALDYRLQLQMIVDITNIGRYITITDMGWLVMSDKHKDAFLAAFGEAKQFINTWWSSRDREKEMKSDALAEDSIIANTLGNMNLRGIADADLRTVFFKLPELRTPRDTALIQQLETQSEVCAYNYLIFVHAVNKIEILKREFPSSLRLTCHAKKGHLCFLMVNTGSFNYPWNGVGVLTKKGTVKVSLEEYVRCDPNYRAVYIKGDEAPFYYEEL